MKSFQKWLRSTKNAISIRIYMDPKHPMVLLSNALEWNYLIGIARKHRLAKVKNAAGRKPHLRILLGVLIVRVIRSCTFRDASDLVQNYGPARYLCKLRFWNWTPDFRTINDFELLLGAEALEEITDYILGVAEKLGFADPNGLCSDTTVQEAKIPYPNEVGLMGSFAKSVDRAIHLLCKKLGPAKLTLLEDIGIIKRLVRKHRLFCKTVDAKRRVEKE